MDCTLKAGVLFEVTRLKCGAIQPRKEVRLVEKSMTEKERTPMTCRLGLIFVLDFDIAPRKHFD